jgi:hypothetical protein
VRHLRGSGRRSGMHENFRHSQSSKFLACQKWPHLNLHDMIETSTFSGKKQGSLGRGGVKCFFNWKRGIFGVVRSWSVKVRWHCWREMWKFFERWKFLVLLPFRPHLEYLPLLKHTRNEQKRKKNKIDKQKLCKFCGVA